MTRALIVAAAVLVLGLVNAAIAGKERIIRGGELVYIDLGPRDPRSLMQGDYMALRLPLAERIAASWAALDASSRPHEGEQRVAQVAVNEQRVASLAARDATGTLPLRYRVRDGKAWIGTNAFFFEEGRDGRYAGARYGELRLDRDTGEAVLVGLRDAKFAPL